MSVVPLTSTTDFSLFSTQSGQKMGRKNPAYSGRWNWGAFFMNWLWLMNHGRVTMGVLILLANFIPFLGILIVWGMAIYLGVNGNDIAYDQRRFLSVEQFVAVQNAWRNWSIALLAISLPVGLIIGIVIAINGGHSVV